MKLNIAAPHALEIPALIQDWEVQMDHHQVMAAMRLADELGYHKTVLGEHFLIPKAHLAATGAYWHHGTVFLAGVAGSTQRIGLASSINLLPLQNAIVQAKAWSTLDWLSGGRATAVVAVGWLKEEFDLLGVPFNERGAICDDYVQAMLALWTQAEPEFDGKYVSFRDVGYEPKPMNLALWFGGDAKAPLKRIAKWGSGWAPFLTPPTDFPKSLDYIKEQPEYDGRPIGLFFPMEAMKIGDGHVEKEQAKGTIGSWNVQETLDLCGWLEDLGVTETIIPLPPLGSVEAYMDRLRWVADEIMPKI